jgi:hypothetical protein
LDDLEALRRIEEQDSLFQAAIQCCNAFLAHCRVAAGSPFVHGVLEHFRLQDGRRYVFTPHSLAWFNGTTGEPLALYDGVNASCASGAIRSPVSGSISIKAIAQSLACDSEPDLVATLLLDAEQRLIELRVREAVLTIGASLEVASDGYMRRTGALGNEQVASLMREHASFAEKRYHRVPQLVSGRSLKLEDEHAFTLVERAYRARNTVAHTGRSEEQLGGAVTSIRVETVSEFLAASRFATGWIQALMAPGSAA